MSIQAIIYVGLGYLGAKAFKRDTVYGTNLTWAKGEVQQVPSQQANQMANNHPDVYALENSERWKQYKAGTLATPELPTVGAEPTIEELIEQRLTTLRKELESLPRAEMVPEHEVVKQLNITFDSTMGKRADKQNHILAVYKTYLLENADKLQGQ